MRARAVIGSGFGDEGKGLMTDYLCAQGAGVVVRFNGGAQAGHTVVTPAGDRHVFSHFGSGTLLGVPTFLSQFFICNPLFALGEADELLAMNCKPELYAHPNCLVTTFADMIINQRREEARGAKRHGSVGLGINETVTRSEALDHLKITMSDLWNHVPLEDRLSEICRKYAEFRTGIKIENADDMIAHFIRMCEKFAAAVHPLGIQQCEDPVFEGAQGLLLDQDNKEFYPHVTRSNTGMKNVRTLCDQAGISDIDTYYVSRTYLTRHGAGPLPGENPKLKFEDNTNIPNRWQGTMRFAPLDTDALLRRCHEDAGGYSSVGGPKFKLVLTHCDQHAPPCLAHLYANGPTRADISTTPRRAKVA